MDKFNEPLGESKNKKLFVILGLALVVAIIIVAAIMIQQQNKTKSGENNYNIPADAKPYIDQEAPNPEDLAPTDVPADGATGEAEVEIPEILREAVIVLDGTNPISKKGQVITPAGDEVKTDVSPMSSEAPLLTSNINKDNLPESAIKLEVSSSGFSPNEFRVKAGAPMVLAVSAVDQYGHVLIFDSPLLQSVSTPLNPGETRARSFNAPAAGEYTFRCDVPGHAGRGETGKMIVE